MLAKLRLVGIPIIVGELHRQFESEDYLLACQANPKGQLGVLDFIIRATIIKELGLSPSGPSSSLIEQIFLNINEFISASDSVTISNSQN